MPLPLRRCLLVAATFVLLAPRTSRAQLADVEAIVSKVEPGVACILVSRSDAYRKFFPVRLPEPGQLGGFDIESVPSRFLDLIPSDFDGRFNKQKRQIFAQKYDLADPDYVPESFGSGLVVDRQGLILTNYHVVQDATKIFVRLPGGKGSYANIHAADPRCDLAALKLIAPPAAGLTPVPLGNADGIRRGQAVIALANPFAAGRNDGQASVSVGVISNLQRRVAGRQAKPENEVVPFDQFGILIQTDARIALGSSGGALLNLQGECIGITTSLAALAGSDAPGGFALPINTGIKKMIETLKRGEEIDYGLLGIIPEDAPSARGAVVSDAQPGSPASVDARLQKGDVILAVGANPIRDRQDVLLNLGFYFAGERVPLTVLRARTRKEEQVSATLVKYRIPDRGKIIASSLGARPFVGGLRVDYSSLMTHNRFATFQSIPAGVLVTEIQDGSKADRLRLIRDDLITHVGGVAVNTPAAFYEQIHRHNGPIDLTIRRGEDLVTIRW